MIYKFGTKNKYHQEIYLKAQGNRAAIGSSTGLRSKWNWWVGEAQIFVPEDASPTLKVYLIRKWISIFS
jgi:hypothetical protein